MVLWWADKGYEYWSPQLFPSSADSRKCLIFADFYQHWIQCFKCFVANKLVFGYFFKQDLLSSLQGFLQVSWGWESWHKMPLYFKGIFNFFPETKTFELSNPPEHDKTLIEKKDWKKFTSYQKNNKTLCCISAPPRFGQVLSFFLLLWIEISHHIFCPQVLTENQRQLTHLVLWVANH